MGTALDTGLDASLDAGVRRSRRLALGTVSYLLGCLTAIATGVFGVAGIGGNMNGLAYAIIVVALVLVTYLLLKAAEWFFVPSVRDALARDARPLVVYLRAFGEDKALVYDVINSGESTIEVTARAEDFLLSLNAVGPLVSLAEPTGLARLGMHPLGAYRDYVGSGDWQERVRQLLGRAGMVVLTIGDSPGIEWEIAEARKRLGSESLLLYLPPRPAGAFTRKGRAKRAQAIYDAFKPLVERHFGFLMPPFSETTYIMGFDAAGKPVLPTNVAPSGWSFTEHAAVRKAIRAQLADVLAKVRPGVDLSNYALLGRSGMWIRTALALTLALAPALLLLSRQPIGGDAAAIAVIVAQALPGVVLIAGWVLLARYFQRLWVWSIPFLSGLSLLIGVVNTYLTIFARGNGLSYEEVLPWIRTSSALLSLVHFVGAFAVLALGLALLGARSAPKSGIPPHG